MSSISLHTECGQEIAPIIFNKNPNDIKITFTILGYLDAIQIMNWRIEMAKRNTRDHFYSNYSWSDLAAAANVARTSRALILNPIEYRPLHALFRFILGSIKHHLLALDHPSFTPESTVVCPVLKNIIMGVFSRPYCFGGDTFSYLVEVIRRTNFRDIENNKLIELLNLLRNNNVILNLIRQNPTFEEPIVPRQRFTKIPFKNPPTLKETISRMLDATKLPAAKK